MESKTFKIDGKEVVISISARALIVDRSRSKILLLQHSNNALILPGGRFTDEELQTNYDLIVPSLRSYPTLSRELVEEIGATGEVVSFLDSCPVAKIGAVTWGRPSTDKKPEKYGIDLLTAFSIPKYELLPIRVDGKEIINHAWMNFLEVSRFIIPRSDNPNYTAEDALIYEDILSRVNQKAVEFGIPEVQFNPNQPYIPENTLNALMAFDEVMIRNKGKFDSIFGQFGREWSLVGV